jgi:hypothetical protein
METLIVFIGLNMARAQLAKRGKKMIEGYNKVSQLNALG